MKKLLLLTCSIILYSSLFAQSADYDWFWTKGEMKRTSTVVNGQRVFNGPFTYTGQGYQYANRMTVTGNYKTVDGELRYDGKFNLVRKGPINEGIIDIVAQGSFDEDRYHGDWFFNNKQYFEGVTNSDYTYHKTFNCKFSYGVLIKCVRKNIYANSVITWQGDELGLLHGTQSEVWDEDGYRVKEETEYIHGVLLWTKKTDVESGEVLGKLTFYQDTSFFKERNFDYKTATFRNPKALTLEKELVAYEKKIRILDSLNVEKNKLEDKQALLTKDSISLAKKISTLNQHATQVYSDSISYSNDKSRLNEKKQLLDTERIQLTKELITLLELAKKLQSDSLLLENRVKEYAANEVKLSLYDSLNRAKSYSVNERMAKYLEDLQSDLVKEKKIDVGRSLFLVEVNGQNQLLEAETDTKGHALSYKYLTIDPKQQEKLATKIDRFSVKFDQSTSSLLYQLTGLDDGYFSSLKRIGDLKVSSDSCTRKRIDFLKKETDLTRSLSLVQDSLNQLDDQKIPQLRSKTQSIRDSITNAGQSARALSEENRQLNAALDQCNTSLTKYKADEVKINQIKTEMSKLHSVKVVRNNQCNGCCPLANYISNGLGLNELGEIVTEINADPIITPCMADLIEQK